MVPLRLCTLAYNLRHIRTKDAVITFIWIRFRVWTDLALGGAVPGLDRKPATTAWREAQHG